MPVILTSSSSAYGLVCVERVRDGLITVRNAIAGLTSQRLSATSNPVELAALLDQENELIESLRHVATVPDGNPCEDVVETAAVIAGAITVWTIIRGSVSLLSRNAPSLDPAARMIQAASLVGKLDKVIDRLDVHLSRDQSLDVDAVFAQAATTVRRHGSSER